MSIAVKAPLSMAAAAAAFSGFSIGQDWYVSGQLQWQKQQDSTNMGSFNEDSIVGIDTLRQTLPDGTVFNPDTYNYQWETSHDEGIASSLEVGRSLPNGFRGSLEVAYEKADVNEHSRGAVSLIGTVDTQEGQVFSSPDTLDNILFDNGEQLTQLAGTPVESADIRQGTNDIVNVSGFANLYYDFPVSERVQPYIGAGVGVTQTEVQYAPDGVIVAETDSTRFAYQGKAGATVKVSDRVEVFGEYTYRATSDVKATLTTSDLLKLDIENKRHLVGIGLRFRFDS